ncbi:LOW QUALITY PROTEIN: F-box/WD repeat-containing protein 10 [Betta splendens]|uniref:LOW QUALITY PROTEIN: F-box/WD repeat-containing protein 10 n=1 Tax=Betta splendens TaxID=158456 RepID=A0A6P7L422_BETSP|nr:LOW QUALITY PROTEIN: F-box/WD repeat-containing protein 10 [Betta splendens]
MMSKCLSTLYKRTTVAWQRRSQQKALQTQSIHMKSAEFGGILSARELGSDAAEGCPNMCGMCAPCVFAPTPPGFIQCSWKVSDGFKRRFVLDLLLRCSSVQVLERVHSVLGVTSWALCASARARSRASPQTHPPFGVDVKRIWFWFRSSPSWMQTRYLCRVLSRCDPELLRMASNLISVLLIRQKRRFLQFSTSFSTNRDQDSDEDPALMVVPGSTNSVCGVSRYRDFIGCLPVDLSKRILGLLKESTLRRCQKVCRYWHRLAKETIEEMKFRISLREQMKTIMARCKSVAVSPTYANFVDVFVPAQDGETQDEPTVQQFTPFEAAYAKIQTKTVQMEERNVYCGAYFTKVLLNREDAHRVVDYRGGALMAAGSRDRVVQLFHVAWETTALSTMKGHVAGIRAVLLCEDRNLVATASGDASIRCWSLKTDRCEAALYGHTGAVTCLDVHGARLVSGAKDCRVKVWDLNTATPMEGVGLKHPAAVRCVKIRAANIYSSCDRGLVKVWDVEQASVVRVIDAHRSSVKCLFVDEWHLLSGDVSGRVMSWSTRSQAEACLISFTHPQEVRSLSLVYLRVLTGCMDGVIRIFNFLTGDCLRNITAENETGRLLSLHFSENSILVNTTSAVKLFQFGKVFWDYAESAAEGSHRIPPCSSDQVDPMASASRPMGGCDRRKQAGAELLHHQRFLSGSTRARGSCQSDAQSLVLSERSARERIEKRGPHHPVTRDSLLLRVGALQRARSRDEVSLNTERNAALRDSWGPNASQGPVQLALRAPNQGPRRDGPSRARTRVPAVKPEEEATAPDSVRRHQHGGQLLHRRPERVRARQLCSFRPAQRSGWVQAAEKIGWNLVYEAACGDS